MTNRARGDAERTPPRRVHHSGFHGTIYVGVTSGLLARIHQHRNGSFRGFTDCHGCKRLVWFEAGGDRAGAIAREKQLKNWLRDWKLALIEAENPTWRDLAEDFGFDPLLARPGFDPGPSADLAHAGHVGLDASPRYAGLDAHARHAGLDPASTFTTTQALEKKGEPRIKSGVTAKKGISEV